MRETGAEPNGPSERFVAELHDSMDALDEAVIRLSNRLMHSSPDAMSAMKKIFWEGTRTLG
jgi:hypothetical protein